MRHFLQISVVPIHLLLTSASRAARIAGVSVRTCRARLTLSDRTLLLLPVGAATDGAAVMVQKIKILTLAR